MLIGQDRAGKTSLMNGFLGLPFNNAEQSTDGIDVKHSKFEFEIDQVTNWQPTNEKFAVPQFLDEIAREAAKHLKNVEAQNNFIHQFREKQIQKIRFVKERNLYTIINIMGDKLLHNLVRYFSVRS